MRYLLLVVLLFFGVGQLSAQVTNIDTVDYPDPVIPKSNTYNFNTDYWYTIAIRTYAYEQFPQLLNQPSGQPYHSSYLNGLLFKINDNQISYRLQAAHFRNDIAFDNECEGCLPQVRGKLRNTAIKVGVEKSVNYSRVQPYFGGDLGFMFQQFSTRGFGNATVFSEDTKNALLCCAVVCTKVYVVPRLALGVEANFNIPYTAEKINRYAVDSVTGTLHQVRRYRWDYVLAPVAAVTILYSLGSIKP